MTAVRGGFATTRWTVVNAVRSSSPEAAEAALSELCQTYWMPLYAYLRRHGHDADAAQDLTQGFFTRVLERRDFRTANRQRGRFRGFLLTALKRYVINEHERASAVMRGGRHVHLSLDFDEAERAYAADWRDDDSPARVFDRKWAGIAMGRALKHLRNEYEQSGKGAIAAALLPYLTDAGDLPPYGDVAAALSLSEGAVKVAVHRLRQRFGAILRREISDTVLTEEDVDGEMRELIRAVST
jgi:RNA polymerase sigma-70 factor (ECF subfamily)